MPTEAADRGEQARPSDPRLILSRFPAGWAEPSPSFLSRGCGVFTRSVHTRLKPQLLHSPGLIYIWWLLRDISEGDCERKAAFVCSLLLEGAWQPGWAAIMCSCYSEVAESREAYQPLCSLEDSVTFLPWLKFGVRTIMATSRASPAGY